MNAYHIQSKENGATMVDLHERDGGKCYLCTKAVDLDAVGALGPSIDHVVPVTRGGSRTIENLRIVHRRCNQRKGGRFVCPHCHTPI